MRNYNIPLKERLNSLLDQVIRGTTTRNPEGGLVSTRTFIPCTTNISERRIAFCQSLDFIYTSLDNRFSIMGSYNQCFWDLFYRLSEYYFDSNGEDYNVYCNTGQIFSKQKNEGNLSLDFCVAYNYEQLTRSEGLPFSPEIVRFYVSHNMINNPAYTNFYNNFYKNVLLQAIELGIQVIYTPNIIDLFLDEVVLPEKMEDVLVFLGKFNEQFEEQLIREKNERNSANTGSTEE